MNVIDGRHEQVKCEESGHDLHTIDEESFRLETCQEGCTMCAFSKNQGLQSWCTEGSQWFTS